MNKIISFLKNNRIFVITILLSLSVGFYFGISYKNYQIRKNLNKITEALFNDEMKENKEIKKSTVLSDEEKNNYISKIDISVNIKEYNSAFSQDNRFNGKARSLKGIIKNNGDKDVKKAELLIIFLDKNGDPIYEDTYNPLYNTDQFKSIILKPNYINEFGFSTDGVPVEWSGQIQYQINDIEY